MISNTLRIDGGATRRSPRPLMMLAVILGLLGALAESPANGQSTITVATSPGPLPPPPALGRDWTAEQIDWLASRLFDDEASTPEEQAAAAELVGDALQDLTSSTAELLIGRLLEKVLEKLPDEIPGDVFSDVVDRIVELVTPDRASPSLQDHIEGWFESLQERYPDFEYPIGELKDGLLEIAGPFLSEIQVRRDMVMGLVAWAKSIDVSRRADRGNPLFERIPREQFEEVLKQLQDLNEVDPERTRERKWALEIEVGDLLQDEPTTDAPREQQGSPQPPDTRPTQQPTTGYAQPTSRSSSGGYGSSGGGSSGYAVTISHYESYVPMTNSYGSDGVSGSEFVGYYIVTSTSVTVTNTSSGGNSGGWGGSSGGSWSGNGAYGWGTYTNGGYIAAEEAPAQVDPATAQDFQRAFLPNLVGPHKTRPAP